MANEQNLRPTNTLTPRERRELSRKGAEATNRKRRERRDMRETFRAMLDMPMRPGGTTTASTLEGMGGKNMTVGQAIALSVLRKALDGDVRAAEFIRDTSGQRPSDRVELTTPSRESADEFSRLLDGAMGDAG
ncbi:hypothetical protein [Olsenella phocaeensis]|uniref:hypothetical protein n=1 Tax=Olsenella phocaeensis TaxID=1852385 RepID=UPI000930B396|nr:hypothetical protein [Olsenella phocaeensis]